MADFNNDTVYILDSYGLIYRCYFAFISRPLTNSKGENISALFGFFRNLHSVLTHYKPRYIAAAMDSRTPTFRHEMYKEYKATRNKTPEDLHAQIPWIEDVLKVLGIPVLRCDGFEADDVIATVATQCQKAGKTCRILSGDKDLMQLVNDTTQILKPDHDAIWKVVGPEGVQAEWGVMPEKLLDLLSLYGDTADNIPGVKGVGVKTACKFLDMYGSLDGIFEHADEISGAIGKKIKDGKESAYFSQKLIRLCSDVPCFTLDDIKPVEFNYKACADKLNEYAAPNIAKSFAELALGNTNDLSQDDKNNSLDLENSENSKKLDVKKNVGNYSPVTKIEELKKIVDDVLALENSEVAFDTETDGLNTHTANLIGFSLCYKAGTAVYVPISKNEDLFSTEGIALNDALHELERLFNNPNVTIIMHNGKFDYEVLRTAGISFNSETGGKGAFIADTMVASWILDSDRFGKSPYSLESLAENNLGLSGIEFTDIVPKGKTFADVPLEKAFPYGAEDSDFTFQLWKLFKPMLQKENLYTLFEKTEMPVLSILAEMEINGIHLDCKALGEYNKELTLDIEKAQNEIFQIVGHEFNIASTKQLQTVLFTERGLKPGKKTKTGFSTDTSVLEELAAWDPVPKKILEFRELSKLQSTYVDALPKLCDKNSRIHTTFLQTGTATGRLSSINPNLQNIPVRNDAGRKIRSAFTAINNTVLISADYAQIELVVLAHLSGDENMQKAFISGTDVHKATASLIYNVKPEDVTPEMRRTAKTINFGVIYGMSAFRLASQLGISRGQAQTFINSYFQTYSSIQNFINDTISLAEKTGFVQTLFGRRRRIININSKNKIEKSSAERIAVNTPVQGSAADIVKKAMIDVDKELKQNPTGAKLLLQVHDELILECPNDKDAIEKTISIIKEKMENAVKLSVPLRVSVECGKNWGEFH